MEYYADFKRTTWMKFEPSRLCERSQSQKAFNSFKIPRIGKYIQTEIILVISRESRKNNKK